MGRIYTRCPACKNDTLCINDDKHLLCTWISCPDPTLIDRIGKNPFIEGMVVMQRGEHYCQFLPGLTLPPGLYETGRNGKIIFVPND